MTKDKDHPYITKLHPIYGIKLYSLDGTIWSTNPAELQPIQERLEKGLVGSIDKRMIPPRRKPGPRPVGEEVIVVQPDNEDGEVVEEELDLEEGIDDEGAPSPRAGGGSRDKRIGEALRLIGDEFGSAEGSATDDGALAEQVVQLSERKERKKSTPLAAKAQLEKEKPKRMTSGKASVGKSNKAGNDKVAKRTAKLVATPKSGKSEPSAASLKGTRTGGAVKQGLAAQGKKKPQKARIASAQKVAKSGVRKVPPSSVATQTKKVAASPTKGVAARKKVARSSTERPEPKKALSGRISKPSLSPEKGKKVAKNAAMKKQGARKGVSKKTESKVRTGSE